MIITQVNSSDTDYSVLIGKNKPETERPATIAVRLNECQGRKPLNEDYFVIFLNVFAISAVGLTLRRKARRGYFNGLSV
jgi:hypothetical protein